MAQSSIGFNGSISAVQWAQSAPLLLSSERAVGTPSDCAVTQVSGQRAVSVAPGQIGGDGVVTTLSSAETVTVPAPSNGQWFLLVLSRTWSSASTALALRNGPTTATATSGSVPASFPASTQTTPGTSSDVPLAWLWASSNSTTVMIVPVILPARLGGRSGTVAQRTAYLASAMPTGAPDSASAAAAMLAFSGLVGTWHNTENNYLERYYGAIDATTNPHGAAAANWYPVGGKLPRLSVERVTNGTWGAVAGTIYPVAFDGTARADNIGWDGTTVTILTPGRYGIAGALGNQTGNQWTQVGIRKNGTDMRRFHGAQISQATSSLEFGMEFDAAAGDKVQVTSRSQTNNLPMIASDGGTLTFLDVTYRCPA